MAFRVSTPDVSGVDLACRLDKPAEYDECFAAIKEAPPKSAVSTYAMCVDRQDYKSSDTVVPNASRATNCLASITMVGHDKWGIAEGLTTIAHAAMATQLAVDGSRGGKDWRGGRCASQNIIPSPTGVARLWAR